MRSVQGPAAEYLAATARQSRRGHLWADPTARRDRMLTDTRSEATQELDRLMGPDQRSLAVGQAPSDLFQARSRPGLRGSERSFSTSGHCRGRAMGSRSTPLPCPPTAGIRWTAPAIRQILDTSDWDQSIAVNTPGQSGQPASAHYSDLAPLWDSGRLLPAGVFDRRRQKRDPEYIDPGASAPIAIAELKPSLQTADNGGTLAPADVEPTQGDF